MIWRPDLAHFDLARCECELLEFTRWRNDSSTRMAQLSGLPKLPPRSSATRREKPAYCIAVLEDISERKRLEAELRQAHYRLDLAVRGSNIGIWEIDMPDGIHRERRQ